MWGIIAWIILGLIAGAIAKAIYPGYQGGGFLATTILGVVGALVGGWIGNLIFPGSTGAAAASVGALTVGGVVFAVLGALIVLFVWGLLSRRAV
ncbi:MAG: GlsB/YeaQ/YmgE family stress response membrane protein [Chroococcidiopsidaceae cyanobacterium CP_BM_ER_R8_30]|nr:GlsB/YeaQ/YmgE family stress response membrane protein [Chroococcidiopsidaceae cyanobacterium CP_BM_ER_R8_30]